MTKFTQLKNEILHSLNHTEQCIKLTEELYSSCEKYAKVKELFWKVSLNILSDQLSIDRGLFQDPDLFIYYVAQLQNCSHAIINNEHSELTIQ